MSCETFRSRILLLEDPAVLPPDSASHVVGCARCKVWHQNLIRVEKSIPKLPVPPSNGVAKAQTVQKIRNAPTPSTKPASGKTKATLARPRRSWRERITAMWPAGLIAATICIGALAWMSIRGNRGPHDPGMPPDPMLDSAVRLNLDVAQAKTPEDRLDAMTRLSEELHREMRDIAKVDSTGEHLSSLRDMYRDVVVRGVPSQARLLGGTAAEKKALLERVKERLNEAERQSEELSTEVPVPAIRPLKETAEAARESMKRLDKILGGI